MMEAELLSDADIDLEAIEELEETSISEQVESREQVAYQSENAQESQEKDDEDKNFSRQKSANSADIMSEFLQQITMHDKLRSFDESSNQQSNIKPIKQEKTSKKVK